MKYEWMNGGNPLPAGHRKAGQIGLVLDFEDGRPEPQNVYAADKDAMMAKLATMYGNTQVRNGELKQATRTAPAAAAPAAAPAAPAEMTPDQIMQAVADLEDPAKAGGAIVKLVKHETGIDMTEQQRAEAARAETARMEGEVASFLRDNPEYHASPRNAKLLRNAVYAKADGGVITAATFQEAFDELSSDGVLESAPTPPEPQEPSAPPANGRRSTGIRPTALRTGGRPAPSGPTMTYAEVMNMAGTDEYADRLRNEPGFRARVEAVLERGA
jgi:hypothetical protein